MLHAGIDALFGRSRDGSRTRHIFQRRRSSNQTDEHDDLTKFFSAKPHLDKNIDHGSTFGFAAMQGWRSSMEDRHKHLISLDKYSWKFWSYFSIFDGHNGICTAKNAADRLDSYLLRELNNMLGKQENNAIKTCVPICSSQVNLDKLHCAIKQTFHELDQDLRKVVKDESGCVCITCLIGSEMIYLINIGDSRAIIISNDGTVLAHTEDHKPDNPHEQERIHEAGGRISKSCIGDVLRVENHLAMTRVLGDFSMDKQIVPPLPDIIQYPRNSLASFVILACDGIWDVMTNDEVALFIVHRASTHTLEELASLLIDECLNRKSTDNMSVYIVRI